MDRTSSGRDETSMSTSDQPEEMESESLGLNTQCSLRPLHDRRIPVPRRDRVSYMSDGTLAMLGPAHPCDRP